MDVTSVTAVLQMPGTENQPEVYPFHNHRAEGLIAQIMNLYTSSDSTGFHYQHLYRYIIISVKYINAVRIARIITLTDIFIQVIEQYASFLSSHSRSSIRSCQRLSLLLICVFISIFTSSSSGFAKGIALAILIFFPVHFCQFEKMCVKRFVHEAIFIHISACDPAKTVPCNTHTACKFKHIVSVNFHSIIPHICIDNVNDNMGKILLQVCENTLVNIRSTENIILNRKSLMGEVPFLLQV